MKNENLLHKIFADEFKMNHTSFFWQQEDGDYIAFGKYRIVPEKPLYRVFCHTSEIGLFSSSRSAVSWCIADNYSQHKMSLEIQFLDKKLTALILDIDVRTKIAAKSASPLNRELIKTKLENKIINKNLIEEQLTKCVNWAKYYQVKRI